MKEGTLEMTITDEGYETILIMFASNILNNIKNSKHWNKSDAVELFVACLRVARHNLASDERLEVLTDQLISRYGKK